MYRFKYLFITFTLSLLTSYSPEFYQPLIPPRDLQVIVHRGITKSAPENTIPALQAAIDANIEWVEIDVRLTRDGRHALLHDSTLDRTTNGAGQVADIDLAALKDLDAGSWFAPRYAGTRIPTLKEVLEYCKNKINLYIDAKAIDPKQIVKEIIETRMERQVVVFDSPERLKEIKRLSNGKIAVMPSINKRLDAEYWVETLHPEAVEIHANLLTADLVQAFHKAGVIVQSQTLGERDNPDIWRTCFAMGVDWIQTDYGENVLAEYLDYRTGGKRPIKVSAHRGANQFAPENTLAAYRKAIQLRVDYIEIDVRTTQDGHLISLHDRTLNRTTNGTGPVNKISFKDLRSLSAGAWFGHDFQCEKVPTIEEICILLNEMNNQFSTELKSREVNLYLDCKDIDTEKLVSVLHAYKKLDNAVFHGSPNVLLEIRRLAPNARLMPSLEQPADLNPSAERLRPFALDTRWSILTKSLIKQAHQRQIQIFSDAMGENEMVEHYRQAIHQGIDTIQTNQILRVYRALELEMYY